MEQPLISVVIPVYNGEKTLRRCLDSVLGQTYPALQVLVVDDGSTDATPALLADYAARDSRLQVLRQPNQGVAAARNRALPLCRGTYIHFCDCDDALPPDALRTLVARALDEDADMVIGAFEMVIGSQKKVRDLGRRNDALPIRDFLALLCKAPNSFYYGVLWNKLFRRELIERLQLRFDPQLAWGEDFDFITRYLTQVQQVAFTRSVVYEYVRNMRGLTMTTGLGVLRRPFHSIALKRIIFRHYQALYIHHQVYRQYRWQLRKYMVSTTLTE